MQPPVVVVVVMVVMMGGCCLGVPAAEDSDLPTPRFQAKRQTNNNNDILLGEHIQEFGLDLASEMQIGGNLVMSPTSVAFLLSSLLLGTSPWSISNQQLHEVLYLPLDINEAIIHNSFKNLLDSLTSSNTKVTLNIANALFLSVNESILTDYSKTAKENYDMQVTQIDFNNLSARNIINDWVSAHTNGMIPNLLKQPLNSATRFFAVNTVFFNGTWQTPFNPSVTKLEPFNTGNDVVQVPMMKTMMPVWYVDIPEMNGHMAALPYEGGQFAMFILMRKGNISLDPLDLQNLENQLVSTILTSYASDMTQLPMTVWLPRMRLSNSTDLRDTLISLGVPAIFSPTDARFHRLIAKEEVWVDQVVHETVVEVTETGTKAAAATGAGLNRIGGSGLNFKVNRPAIIFIRDMKSGLPLFWARVQNPEPLTGTV